MKRKQKLWPATGKSKGGLDWSELSHPIYSIYNERRLLGARWLYSFQVASPSPQDSRRFLSFSLFIMNWIMGFMFYFHPLYLFYLQVWFVSPVWELIIGCCLRFMFSLDLGFLDLEFYSLALTLVTCLCSCFTYKLLSWVNAQAFIWILFYYLGSFWILNLKWVE